MTEYEQRLQAALASHKQVEVMAILRALKAEATVREQAAEIARLRQERDNGAARELDG